MFEESNRASQLAIQRAKHKIGPFHAGYASHIHPELLPVVRDLRFRQPSYPLIEMESSTTHDIVQASPPRKEPRILVGVFTVMRIEPSCEELSQFFSEHFLSRC